MVRSVASSSSSPAPPQEEFNAESGMSDDDDRYDDEGNALNRVTDEYQGNIDDNDPDALFTNDGKPVVFCLHGLTKGQTRTLSRQIRDHGGLLCDHGRNDKHYPNEEEADVLIVPYTRLNHVRTVSYFGCAKPYVEAEDFVRTCISAGRYKHAPLRFQKISGAPRGKTHDRTPWTAEAVEGMLRFIARVDPYNRGGRTGFLMYKRAIAKNEERPTEETWVRGHTFESIRQRYRDPPARRKEYDARIRMYAAEAAGDDLRRGQYEFKGRRLAVEALSEESEDEVREVRRSPVSVPSRRASQKARREESESGDEVQVQKERAHRRSAASRKAQREESESVSEVEVAVHEDSEAPSRKKQKRQANAEEYDPNRDQEAEFFDFNWDMPDPAPLSVHDVPPRYRKEKLRQAPPASSQATLVGRVPSQLAGPSQPRSSAPQAGPSQPRSSTPQAGPSQPRASHAGPSQPRAPPPAPPVSIRQPGPSHPLARPPLQPVTRVPRGSKRHAPSRSRSPAPSAPYRNTRARSRSQSVEPQAQVARGRKGKAARGRRMPMLEEQEDVLVVGAQEPEVVEEEMEQVADEREGIVEEQELVVEEEEELVEEEEVVEAQEADTQLVEDMLDGPGSISVSQAPPMMDSDDRRTHARLSARARLLDDEDEDEEEMARLAGELSAPRPAVALSARARIEPLRLTDPNRTPAPHKATRRRARTVEVSESEQEVFPTPGTRAHALQWNKPFEPFPGTKAKAAAEAKAEKAALAEAAEAAVLVGYGKAPSGGRTLRRR